jgi:hypothetical protein
MVAKTAYMEPVAGRKPAQKQFQEKWFPLFCPELRRKKKMDRFIPL